MKNLWPIVIIMLIFIACQPPHYEGVNIERIPWTQVEHSNYDIIRHDTVIGSMSTTIESIGGGYKITSLVNIREDTVTLRDSTYLVLDSLLNPLLCHKYLTGSKTPLLVEAQYGTSKVVVRMVPSTGSRERTLRIRRPIYDNEEIYHLLRTIPYHTGYEARFYLMSTFAARFVPVSIEVCDTEPVTLSYGVKEGIKIRLRVNRTSHYFWYEANPPHRMLKYHNKWTNVILLHKRDTL
ncbi:hypothetical protein CGW93_02905 [candidate division bacterium WOR-3 4484_18]|uniref:DUF3108 domain-containing protein n=1 Tax=candidate division WOR-3 bacterium 4484_18 TaxID=2020626 RepID=A0A257LTL0_UNCW3|nr:MAG: hypothetical protein CGW93_02905 [candidate division bacterium WOR-3 4484_18]